MIGEELKKAKARQYAKEYYKKNKVHISKLQKQYKEKNREKIIEYSKKSYEMRKNKATLLLLLILNKCID